MKNYYIYLLVSLFGLISCNKTNMADSSPQIDIPYSSESALNEYANDSTIVDYNFARQIAYVDMTINNTFEEQGWSNGLISDKPVIVYGFDFKPLYYDFIILSQTGLPIGSISVHARKTNVIQIERMSKNIESYLKVSTKTSSHNVLLADNSGRRYISTLNNTKTGVFSATDIKTGKIVCNLKPMSNQEAISLMKTEILQNMYSDKQKVDDIVDSIQQRVIASQQAADKFWNMVSQNKDAIMTYKETKTNTEQNNDNLNIMFANIDFPRPEELPEEDPFNPTPPTPPAPPRYYLSTQQNYNGKLTWLTQFHEKSKNYGQGGYCGQWTCAFIVGAYGYKDILSDQIPSEIGEGPMRLTDLSRVIGRYSHNYLGASYTERSQWDVYWWVIQNAKPSYRFTITGGIPHWTIIYGSYRIERALATNYYFMQIDNGALIGNERVDRQPDNADNYTGLSAIDLLYFIND